MVYLKFKFNCLPCVLICFIWQLTAGTESFRLRTRGTCRVAGSLSGHEVTPHSLRRLCWFRGTERALAGGTLRSDGRCACCRPGGFRSGELTPGSVLRAPPTQPRVGTAGRRSAWGSWGSSSLFRLSAAPPSSHRCPPFPSQLCPKASLERPPVLAAVSLAGAGHVHSPGLSLAGAAVPLRPIRSTRGGGGSHSCRREGVDTIGGDSAGSMWAATTTQLTPNWPCC